MPEEKPANPFLAVDWRVKPYEILFILFGLVTILLVSATRLEFALVLFTVFLRKCVELTGLTLLLSMFLIAYKGIKKGREEGWDVLKEKDIRLELIKPYLTLNFTLLTFRRCVSIFGVIFFFLHLKHIILLVHEGNYDLFFWNLDRTLHFGVQPNVWLMERFGQSHDFSIVIDWLYYKYFDYQMFICILFLLEPGGRKIAEAFFLAYGLCWSVGGMGYLAFPADGPCYAVLMEKTVPENMRDHIFDFPVIKTPPRSYVEAFGKSKIWIAKAFQKQLWKSRHRFFSGAGAPGYFYGIAAMPSLHIMVVTMMALALYRVSVIAFVVATIYAITTFTGSVFLQWHYAVDGYVGAVLAALVWWISMRITTMQNIPRHNLNQATARAL